MTSESQPSGSKAPGPFDTPAALAHARVLKLELDESLIQGVNTNLELLAKHHAAVLRGLASMNEAPS
jgi:hypothetical protein